MEDPLDEDTNTVISIPGKVLGKIFEKFQAMIYPIIGIAFGTGGFFSGQLSAMPSDQVTKEEVAEMIGDLEEVHSAMATRSETEDIFYLLCLLANEHQVKSRRCHEVSSAP